MALKVTKPSSCHPIPMRCLSANPLTMLGFEIVKTIQLSSFQAEKATGISPQFVFLTLYHTFYASGKTKE